MVAVDETIKTAGRTPTRDQIERERKQQVDGMREVLRVIGDELHRDEFLRARLGREGHRAWGI
jgi:hypothetical protein